MLTFGVCGSAPDSLRGAGLNGVVFCKPAGVQDGLLLLPGNNYPRGARAGTVVAPPEAEPECGDAHWIIYGMGPKDSVTYSSLSDDGRVLSLQREIVSLFGKRVERQEIPLPAVEEPELQLAVSAALLAAGMSGESLSRYWTRRAN